MQISQLSKGRLAVLVLTNLVALGALIYALHDAELSRLGDDLRRLSWVWIVLALATEVVVYFCQALRWRAILAPVARMRVGQAARAVYIGMLASETLPVRGGELVRCYLVNRWTKLPFPVAVASVLIERVFDGVLLWFLLRLVLDTIPLPSQMALADEVLGVVVLAGVVLLAAALFLRRPKSTPLPEGKIARRLRILMDDLAIIGHSWSLWGGVVLTVPYYLLQVVPFWVLYRVYGFDLGWESALALMLMLRLASIVPQAPATLGVYQLLTKEFLELTGIPAPEAARFSLLAWAVTKLPVIAAGVVSLFVTQAKLGELSRAAQEASEAGRAR